jgi:hypothetical protein
MLYGVGKSSSVFVIATLKNGLSRASSLYVIFLMTLRLGPILPVPIFVPLIFMHCYSCAMTMEAASSSETVDSLSDYT